MDPQATLDRLRELVFENVEAETNEHKADIADEFSELVEALDNWLCCGGFLPASWALKDDEKTSNISIHA